MSGALLLDHAFKGLLLQQFVQRRQGDVCRCSEGILAGEMKHGPLALVDEHMPVLAVATRDAMWSKMQSVIAQLLARKSQLIVMCNEGDSVTMELCSSHGCQTIEVRTCLPVASINIPCRQIAVYARHRSHGSVCEVLKQRCVDSLQCALDADCTSHLPSGLPVRQYYAP